MQSTRCLPPDNKQQLQHFLGMVTYLSPFIPSLSTHTAPLQELLKKDSEFMWNPDIPGSLQPDQEIGLQGHHTPVLQCSETCHCPSWCIKEGTWSCTPARRTPSCLCFQSSYPHRAMICQHRTWDVSLHLRSWTISHLCLWPCLHHREWPQTPGANQPEEPCWYPSLTSMDAAQTTELWCHH